MISTLCVYPIEQGQKMCLSWNNLFQIGANALHMDGFQRPARHILPPLSLTCCHHSFLPYISLDSVEFNEKKSLSPPWLKENSHRELLRPRSAHSAVCHVILRWFAYGQSAQSSCFSCEPFPLVPFILSLHYLSIPLNGWWTGISCSYIAGMEVAAVETLNRQSSGSYNTQMWGREIQVEVKRKISREKERGQRESE